MHFLPYLIVFTILAGSGACAFYLYKNITRQNAIISFAGLLLLILGNLLLILDLTLVAIIHGPQSIPDYLIFNRLVADTGFSGRWMLTSYVFIGSGFLIFLYVAAIKLQKIIKSKVKPV